MPYTCDSDDGNAANILITILDEGETLAVCNLCFPAWIAMMHNELNPPQADAEPPQQLDGPSALDVAESADLASSTVDPVTGDESDEDEHADADEPTGLVVPTDFVRMHQGTG